MVFLRTILIKWRRHPDLNRGIAVLQTAALPLGYAAIKFNRTRIYADNRRNKKDALPIVLSDFLCTSVSAKEFLIQ